MLLLQGRAYLLPDVWIRPPLGGKGRKMTGQLEAHANGFRYLGPKGEVLDIMYRCARQGFEVQGSRVPLHLPVSLSSPVPIHDSCTGAPGNLHATIMSMKFCRVYPPTVCTYAQGRRTFAQLAEVACQFRRTWPTFVC